MFAVEAAAAEGQFIYDCSWCQRYQPPDHRAYFGCRRDLPGATSQVQIDALEGQAVIDHCPGIYVDTPFTGWVFDTAEAVKCGYHLGAYGDAPAPQAESLMILARARRKAAEIAERRAAAEAETDG